MRQRRRYASAALLVGTCAVAVGGCHDATDQTVSRATAPYEARPSLVQADADWDTFSADVSITMTGGESVKLPSLRPRRARYHTERALGPDNAWTSSITLTEPLSSERLGRRRIGKIAFDEGTGTTHVYDVEGNEQPIPSRDALPPSLQTPLALPSSDVKPAHGGQKTKNVRAWAGNVLLGPQERERQRASIEHTFGKPVERRGGHDVYRVVRADRTMELVSDQTGLVIEQNLSRKGKLTAHTTYTYSESSPGVFVRTGTHAELAPRDDRSRSLVIDETLTNVRFERRGGQH